MTVNLRRVVLFLLIIIKFINCENIFFDDFNGGQKFSVCNRPAIQTFKIEPYSDGFPSPSDVPSSNMNFLKASVTSCALWSNIQLDSPSYISLKLYRYEDTEIKGSINVFVIQESGEIINCQVDDETPKDWFIFECDIDYIGEVKFEIYYMTTSRTDFLAIDSITIAEILTTTTSEISTISTSSSTTTISTTLDTTISTTLDTTISTTLDTTTIVPTTADTTTVVTTTVDTTTVDTSTVDTTTVDTSTVDTTTIDTTTVDTTTPDTITSTPATTDITDNPNNGNGNKPTNTDYKTLVIAALVTACVLFVWASVVTCLFIRTIMNKPRFDNRHQGNKNKNDLRIPRVHV